VWVEAPEYTEVVDNNSSLQCVPLDTTRRPEPIRLDCYLSALTTWMPGIGRRVGSEPYIARLVDFDSFPAFIQGNRNNGEYPAGEEELFDGTLHRVA
jgi:hypothetical protein